MTDSEAVPSRDEFPHGRTIPFNIPGEANMATKILAGVVAMAILGLTGGGVYLATAKDTAKKDACCYPGAACCEAGLACCETGDCCTTGAGCCEPAAKDTTVKAKKTGCCDVGGACCEVGGTCCGDK